MLALLLAGGMAWLLHTRTAERAGARGASFFEDATAIEGAFRKALGPHPPVLELVIEGDLTSARVVVGATATQQFLLVHENGYVTAGPAREPTERDDVAFSMSSVPFGAVPRLVGEGTEALGAAPARLVIDRLPGAKVLRFRAYADDGRHAELKTPDP